jgi:hypothetical protein
VTRQRGGIVLRMALLGTLALLASCAAIGYLRVTALPDLGAPPRGPSAGTTQIEVAASLGTQLVKSLITAEHAKVSLSEQDLTVVVTANNPDPRRFASPSVRVRDGLVVVAADTDFGPLSVTGVGRVALVLTGGSDGLPDIAVEVREIDAGELTLPGFARDDIAHRMQQSLTMRHLFGANPTLSRLRPYLECVGVSAVAVVLGFRRPLSTPRSDTCA